MSRKVKIRKKEFKNKRRRVVSIKTISELSVSGSLRHELNGYDVLYPVDKRRARDVTRLKQLITFEARTGRRT